MITYIGTTMRAPGMTLGREDNVGESAASLKMKPGDTIGAQGGDDQENSVVQRETMTLFRSQVVKLKAPVVESMAL